MERSMAKLIVRFGDDSVVERNVGKYPAAENEFVLFFATSFDIPSDALGPQDRRAVLEALIKLRRGESDVRVSLDYVPRKDIQPVFPNLMEFLYHYLNQTQSASFWINYSTWKDFFTKLRTVFLSGNPPRSLKTLVIRDNEEVQRYNLEQGEKARPTISRPRPAEFIQSLRTQKDTVFVLEDFDVTLETYDNFRGEQEIPMKSVVKNILESGILDQNNSVIIVAASATEEIRIPSQLKGFWVPWRDASKDYPVLESLGENMTAKAKAGKFNPVLGRDVEIDKLITVLTKDKYNNVLITGRPGIGKTEVVRGLAQRIADGRVPEELKDVRIFDVMFANILKDMSVAGSLEARITNLVNEVKSHRKEVIVFFDEFHQLMGNETIRNVLKPVLANGEFPCMGATTDDEFRQYVAGADEAFYQRFFKLELDELPEPIIKEILLAQIARKNTDIKIDSRTLDYFYWCCKKLQPLKALPRSGEVVMGNILNDLNNQQTITHESITRSFPVGQLALRLSTEEGFKRLLNAITRNIRGQDEQIRAVLETLRNHFFLLTKVEKPLVMMFMGPTGTGKTELAIQLCKHIWTDENRYLLFNMGSVEQKTAITGAPPGYVGYEDSSPILNFLSTHDSGIIILDEFEKVFHEKKILDAFLEMMDKGTTAGPRGRKMSFRPFIFILTSNLAAEASGRMSEREKTDVLVEAGLRKEFIGRIKLIEVFNRISRDTAMGILRELIEDYNKRPDYFCRFEFDQAVLEHILDEADFVTYGVRQVQTTLARLMNEILFRHSDKLFQDRTFKIGLLNGIVAVQ